MSDFTERDVLKTFQPESYRGLLTVDDNQREVKMVKPSDLEIKSNPEQWAMVQAQLKTIYPDRYLNKGKDMNEVVQEVMELGEVSVNPEVAVTEVERSEDEVALSDVPGDQ